MLLKQIAKKESRQVPLTVEEQRYKAIMALPFAEADADDIQFVKDAVYPHHSFFQLTGLEVSWFNALATKQVTVATETWGAEEFKSALGIYVLEKGDKTPDLTSYQGNRYAARKNGSNRKFKPSNMQKLLKFCLSGRWAQNYEVLIFDDNGEAASAQHRDMCWFFASLVDPTFRVTVLVVRGLPKALVGSVDTGASRSKKDELQRFGHLVIPHMKPAYGGDYGKDTHKVADTISAEMSSAASLIFLRANGKDVHSSTTGFDQSELFDMLELTPEFPELACRVYASTDGVKARQGIRQYSNGELTAALVLASNAENPSEVSVVKTPRGGKREYELPPSIDIDMELAERFLSALQQPWLSPLLDYLAKTPEKRKEKEFRFAGLVNAIKHFDAHCSQVEFPAPIDPETKQVIGEPTVGWSCIPLPAHGVPSVPRENQVWQWPTFGGLDVGYQQPIGKGDIDLMVS